MGISVPIRDASWETSNLYEDLYQRPFCCANVCKNVESETGEIVNLQNEAEGELPASSSEPSLTMASPPSPGRYINTLDSPFELMNCDVCGSKSIHLSCGGLTGPLDDWACPACVGILAGECFLVPRNTDENLVRWFLYTLFL